MLLVKDSAKCFRCYGHAQTIVKREKLTNVREEVGECAAAWHLLMYVVWPREAFRQALHPLSITA
jgi:hypothetical protein